MASFELKYQGRRVKSVPGLLTNVTNPMGEDK